MATTPRSTPPHRPPPSGGATGRGHLSPLGGGTVQGGGQVLRGGAGGVVIRSPLKYRAREEPVGRKRGNTVPLVG
jgi:hypothetical protein